MNLFEHQLGSIGSYPSLLAGTVWRCSDPFVPEANSEISQNVGDPLDVNVVRRANCTEAIIIDSSQQVVKIPWQEAKYPSLPHSLEDN